MTNFLMRGKARGRTAQAILDAVDLLHPERGPDAASIRPRLARTVRSILWFAAGGGGRRALLLGDYRAGFWCLAIPAVVAAVTAFEGERLRA